MLASFQMRKHVINQLVHNSIQHHGPGMAKFSKHSPTMIILSTVLNWACTCCHIFFPFVGPPNTFKATAAASIEPEFSKQNTSSLFMKICGQLLSTKTTASKNPYQSSKLSFSFLGTQMIAAICCSGLSSEQ